MTCLEKQVRWLFQQNSAKFFIFPKSVFSYQDLVYFWTGSPALPASEEGFQPMPTVTIRYCVVSAFI
jgi:hypothetical protein